MDKILFAIAQGLGGVAVILGFASFLQKSQKGILIFQVITGLVFTAHYLLLGAYSAVPLNFVSSVACVVYYFRDKRGSTGKLLPAIFTTVAAVLGLLAWEGWHSALVVAGVMVGTVGLSCAKPRHTRLFVLLKSPLCLAYNAWVFSVGGVVYECAILLSAILGLIRDRKTEK